MYTVKIPQNSKIARVITTAFLSHLWNLSEILTAFALFKDAATKEEKNLMVAALHEVEGLLNEFNYFSTETQRHFITFDKKHKQFLTILGISHGRSSCRMI